MKKEIIPVCLACVMFVSACKRDIGCGHGVVDPGKDLEYGNNSYIQTRSSGYRKSSSKDSPDIKKGARRSGVAERPVKEAQTVKNAITSSKKAGYIRSHTAETAGMTRRVSGKTEISAFTSESEKGDSASSQAGKEPKPGSLLVKPRVDVPEVK